MRQRQRREERKYKRIFVRYGPTAAEHQAVAQQISVGGLFLLTNGAVYANNSALVIEIKGPAETWLVAGIVRHAVKVPRSLAGFAKPGMGVELTAVPPACRDYLASL